MVGILAPKGGFLCLPVFPVCSAPSFHAILYCSSSYWRYYVISHHFQKDSLTSIISWTVLSFCSWSYNIDLSYERWKNACVASSDSLPAVAVLGHRGSKWPPAATFVASHRLNLYAGLRRKWCRNRFSLISHTLMFLAFLPFPKAADWMNDSNLIW